MFADVDTLRSLEEALDAFEGPCPPPHTPLLLTTNPLLSTSPFATLLCLPFLRLLLRGINCKKRPTLTGSLMVISHDRFFLDRICDSIIAFEGDGKVNAAAENAFIK